MNWKMKSAIQRFCSRVWGGDRLYFVIQRTCGRLRHPRYQDRIRQHIEMARLLAERGIPLQGRTCFEIGTGWIPILPVGFWLCGAERIYTYDLNRYLSFDLLAGFLHWLIENRNEIRMKYEALVPSSLWEERMRILSELQNHPAQFLDRVQIHYVSPGDAAQTGLPEAGIDIHYSNLVFEHIPKESIAAILAEAGRILKPDGIAIHFVDPTDHFAHGDTFISNIHFLSLDDRQYRKHYMNRYAYCNRLLEPDYLELFAKSPLELIYLDSELDVTAMEQLRQGFRLAAPFRNYPPEIICKKSLKLLAVAKRDK